MLVGEAHTYADRIHVRRADAQQPAMSTPKADTPAYCPKSDEGVRSAVKQGALVVGLGKAAQPVAAKLREALAHRCTTKSDDWEVSKVNHLVVVVECGPSGDCCEAAAKFQRNVRASDGYSVYSDIIQRKVAVLGLGKASGKGAAKVEEVLLKRGGCKRLLGPAGALGALPADADVAALPWTQKVSAALEATMDPPPPKPAPVPATPAPPPAEEPAKATPVTEQPAQPPPPSVGGCPYALPSISPTVVVAVAAAAALVFVAFARR